MAKYIKSYSNYVLRTKHQNISDGTIFERDITTIGGRDRFSKGQVPVYKSGNFVITINNDINDFKKLSEQDWHRSDAGDVWTLDVLKYYDKDEKSSDDRKIVIKKDYHDLRDFAYYGSCSELIRVSVNDILRTYPGELFTPYEKLYVSKDGGKVQYTEEAAKQAFGENGYNVVIQGIKGYYTSFDLKYATDEEKIGIEEGRPYSRIFKYLTNKEGKLIAEKSLSLIDNPFGINIHSKTLPEEANPLKYFADDGIKNYVGYIKENFDDEWEIDKDHEYSIEISDVIFDGIGEEDNIEQFFFAIGGNCPNINCDGKATVEIEAKEEVERILKDLIDCIVPGKYIGKIVLCFKKNDYTFRTIPGLKRDSDTNKPIEVCCDGRLTFDEAGGEGKYQGEDTIIESLKMVDSKVDFKYNTTKVGVCDTEFDINLNAVAEDGCAYYLTIYMFMGNNNEIKYLIDDEDLNNFNIRIRPKENIIDDYFYNLDLFEKVLLDRTSSPLYTANFEIINENDFGFYTQVKQFTFPTTYGGYNLGSTSQAFNSYVSDLVELGEYYDGLFTDNLWRSMTHESIKNFDWTYTRRYTPGEEEPFIEGGAKIQKVIRIYGREFDELNTYIDAIDDFNTVTYDNINNLPDYFFTDKLEEEGWDVKLIHPLILSEFVNGYSNVPIDIGKLFPKKYKSPELTDENRISTPEAEKLNYFYDSLGNKMSIQRVFNQDFSEIVVKPYSCSNITSIREIECDVETEEIFDVGNGNCPNPSCEKEFTVGVVLYNEKTSKSVQTVERTRLDVCPENIELCKDKEKIDIEVTKEVGEDASKGYHNECCDFIKIYCDENEYTSSDVNNEFMKRLLLNSREIWRHKGTIEGMEMLLSIFGLRSKNRVYTDERYFVNQNGTKECLSLTEEGKTYYRNYKCYINSLYDYDIKEYTMFTTREEDTWLPEKNMYMYDWVNSTKLVTYNTEDFKNGKYTPYQGLTLSFRENKQEKKRYLYPHFETKGIYDGDPYYQMNGGWMQKKPFMFDVKNNIIPENYNENNRKKLFTETVKNINCVQNIQDLLSNPSLASHSGDICQVIDLSGRYAIVDGTVYPILTENNDVDESKSNIFFYVQVQNNSLVVGNAFFTDYVIVSNPYYNNSKQRIDLSDDFYNDRMIKIYILTTEDGNYDINVYSNESSINTFTVFENGKYMDGDNYTNYFRINDIDYYGELSVLGWQQLRSDEYEYYKLDSIIDYREGNNPHTGHMNYDNGHEYLSYFKNIFKYVSDNDLIDYRKYDDGDLAYLDDARDFGFSNLLREDYCDKEYDEFLREDNKCHYFGQMYSKVDKNCNDSRESLTCFLKRNSNNEMAENGKCITAFKINDIYRKALIKDDGDDNKPKIEFLRYGNVYDFIGEEGEYDESKFDHVTDQIVNTKRMEIEFFIKNKKEYSKEWLEEVKYIDYVILPYLTQMIPSTVIWSVKYTTRNSVKWGFESNDCPDNYFNTDKDSIVCTDKRVTQYELNLTAEKVS